MTWLLSNRICYFKKFIFTSMKGGRAGVLFFGFATVACCWLTGSFFIESISIPYLIFFYSVVILFHLFLARRGGKNIILLLSSLYTLY